MFPVLDWRATSAADRAEFREHVLAGGIFVLPTETVYGLAAEATSDAACQAIFSAKGRPSDNPLITHFADFADARPYLVPLTELEERLVSAFMPGPFTLILGHASGISSVARAGGDTVAVRVPEHSVARDIIATTGRPIAAPSANPSGSPSATTAAMARGYFPELPYVWDGGDADYGIESTVARVSGDTVRVLRPGYIGVEDIAQVLLPHERAEYGSAGAGESVVPGAKYRHYAPQARVSVLSANTHAVSWPRDDSRVALLASAEYIREHAQELMRFPHIAVFDWGSRANLPALAGALYARYHQFDRDGYARILVEAVPEATGLGRAIMNRVTKSASWGSLGPSAEHCPTGSS